MLRSTASQSGSMNRFFQYAPYAIAALGASSGLQGLFAPALRAGTFGLSDESGSPLMPLVGVRDLVGALTTAWLAYNGQYRTLATVGLLSLPVALVDAYIAHVRGSREKEGQSKGIGHLVAAVVLGGFFLSLRQRSSLTLG